eukprot:TRINITY_DN20249_c0_g1_i1.p1 TRINITY_DN20249_c0_g1~~TRINITY_DN20249_c0_g1_i1.p1  ORF type:complete len:514 (-),score=88.44 TRINITY_DN20249_c0_g1_i1:42-1478(-)
MAPFGYSLHSAKQSVLAVSAVLQLCRFANLFHSAKYDNMVFGTAAVSALAVGSVALSSLGDLATSSPAVALLDHLCRGDSPPFLNVSLGGVAAGAKGRGSELDANAQQPQWVLVALVAFVAIAAAFLVPLLLATRVWHRGIAEPQAQALAIRERARFCCQHMGAFQKLPGTSSWRCRTMIVCVAVLVAALVALSSAIPGTSFGVQVWDRQLSERYESKWLRVLSAASFLAFAQLALKAFLVGSDGVRGNGEVTSDRDRFLWVIYKPERFKMLRESEDPLDSRVGCDSTPVPCAGKAVDTRRSAAPRCSQKASSDDADKAKMSQQEDVGFRQFDRPHQLDEPPEESPPSQAVCLTSPPMHLRALPGRSIGRGDRSPCLSDCSPLLDRLEKVPTPNFAFSPTRRGSEMRASSQSPGSGRASYRRSTSYGSTTSLEAMYEFPVPVFPQQQSANFAQELALRRSIELAISVPVPDSDDDELL